MRRELILIFRFFCLDKNLIVSYLKERGSGGIARDGHAIFEEPDVHEIMSQALCSV